MASVQNDDHGKKMAYFRRFWVQEPRHFSENKFRRKVVPLSQHSPSNTYTGHTYGYVHDILVIN